MRKLLLLAVLLGTANLLFAQESTRSGANGKWITNAMWTDGSRAGTVAGENVTVSGVNITINGVVTVGSSMSVPGTLTFGGNDDTHSITINGTLIVFGNVSFGTDAMTLNLASSGLLIVFGDLELNNKVDLSSTGNIVVTGEIKKNGGQSTITGTGDFYAGSYNGGAQGAQTAIGNGPPDRSLNTGTDLSTNLPNVANYLNCISSGGTASTCSPSQCNIVSTDGYTVRIYLDAVAIVPDRNPCPFGYNYNVRVNYNISFTGSNIPAGGLWTLQGNVTCNGQSIFFDLPNTGGQGTLTTTGNPWRNATDCNTATVISLGCNAALVDIQGPGIATQSCNATLPIKLRKFEGGENADGVDLRWVTTMEKNFSHFEVQKSTSEELSFESIAEIPARGGLNIETSYSYVDTNPLLGRNYYRLKNVDLDGSVEYSNVIAIKWDRGEQVSVYPNPVVEKKFTLMLNDLQSGSAMMRIYNELGGVKHEQIVDSKVSEVTLPATLPTGFYSLKVQNGLYQKVIKLIVR